MRLINGFIVSLIAPFIGLCIVFSGFNNSSQALLLNIETVDNRLDELNEMIISMKEDTEAFSKTAIDQETRYRFQQDMLFHLSDQTVEQKQLSDQIYEQRILSMLGPPVKGHQSERVEIKIFKLDELGYRGYIAKIKLFDPQALKVVLAKDTLGERETALQALERTEAILAINGGGFYTEMREGKPYSIHIGNTIINGEFVNRFNNYPPELFFVGIDRKGELIGGQFPEKEQLTRLNPWQGVSFVPILIQGGHPLPIPKEWVSTRQPRTIIGEYANGDLIMIVVDGRQADWSSGVTLERLQVKLAELGVKEAYNLDGGGSSSFVFNGEVLNRPSDGRLRQVVTNIVILP